MAIVYLHLTEENIPFYIGIGKNVSRAYDFKGRSSFWNSIKSKYGIKIQILHSKLRWEEAVNKEIELIKFYGRRDLNTGTLCNLTRGGEGVVGNIVSEEQKQKLREFNLGKKHTKETKLKLSKSVVQLTCDFEYIATYSSMKEAQSKTSVNFRGISEVCRGNRERAGGYRWLYESDYNKSS